MLLLNSHLNSFVMLKIKKAEKFSIKYIEKTNKKDVNKKKIPLYVISFLKIVQNKIKVK